MGVSLDFGTCFSTIALSVEKIFLPRFIDSFPEAMISRGTREFPVEKALKLDFKVSSKAVFPDTCYSV